MIAYNNQWLENLQVRNQSDTAADRHLISSEENAGIAKAYTVGFYSPNIFVQIGLFILTCIIVQFTLGLVSLMFLSVVNDKALGSLFIFFGLAVYAGLEFMVKRNHYKSGVDDALMWMAGGAIIGGINAIGTVSWLANAIIILAIALFFFLRFVNAIMAGIAAIALIAVVFLSVVKFGTIAKAVAPFLIMIVAALLYLWAQALLRKKHMKFYYTGLQVITVIALVCFYTAGNYFVVREASVAMFNLDLKPGETIPLGWLFWFFTIVIPLAYISRGIQKKDAVLLRIGLLLVAAVVFTFRYYYHVLPAETAMVIGGILFIAIAYFLMKYLHEPKHGFTHKEQDEKLLLDKLNIESLVIAQTFSGPQLPGDTGPQFGGGSGGGGGATGGF